MARSDPRVEDGQLILPDGPGPARLAVGSAARFAWLVRAEAFAYAGPEGNFGARKERAGHGRGRPYWRAYRRRDGRLRRLYLGPDAALTLARLRSAAAALAADPLNDPPGGPTGLVGRDREYAALRAALAAALAGRGSLALIGGEAGIGKTALAEALLAEAAARGARVLVGRCYDLAETPPYGPWAEALARAPDGDGLPALPAAVLPPGRAGEPLGGQEAIVARVLAYLAALAAARPLVLLLEDLHWADPASLDLLRVAARRPAEAPLLLLATYRADEVARGQPLFALLPHLAREARAARLDLRPLDAAAIDALVAARYPLPAADRARLVAYLAGRTEGNALFLGELLRTLEGDGGLRRDGAGWGIGDLAAVPVPALLRQVIAGRLHRLPPETERLLAVAAVIGQEVPLATWAAVADETEDALLEHGERATAARLLVETADGAGYRFAHALIREALYEATPAPRRRAWHRRAGEALGAWPDPDPDAVANHFQRAGDPRAVEWLVRAGLRAHAGAARITAAARFAAAAGLLAGDASRAGERGWLFLLGGHLLTFADTDAALRHLAAAEALARAADDPVLAAHVHSVRGTVLCHRPRDVGAGVAELERAVAAVEALPPAYRRWTADLVALARAGALLPAGEGPTLPAQARTLPAALDQRRSLATQYGYTGRYREARALGEAAVAAALANDPALRDVPASHGLAIAYAALGRSAESRREFALLRTALNARNDLYTVAYSTWAELQHAVLPCQADDLAERARLAAEVDRAWATVQDTVIAAPYPSQAGLPIALLEGRWAEARRLAEAAVARATIGHAQGAGAALGVLARWQGDPEAAWARVRERHPAGPDTAPGDCHFLPGRALQALAAELALDAGDLATADRWIAAHGRWLDWSGAALWQAEHLLLRARHARLSGDAAAAAAHAAAALARAAEPRQPLALLAAHRLLGELTTAGGDLPAARAHLDASLALADACAAPYERALTLLALAEVRAAEDRRADAAAALAAARARLAPLEAAPALARAAALAAHLAAPPAPLAPARPFGLSAREAEVLALVAEGLTNAQVAARLFVTPRTIGAHLTAVYTKLGVDNRAAAIRAALDHGLA